ILILHLCQLGSLICCDQAVDDLVQVAVQYAVQLVEGQFDTVISNPSLREVISTDLLGTVSCSDLAPSCFRLRCLLLLKFQIVKLGTEQPECLLLILQLRLFCLAVDHDPCRIMSQTDCRVCCVDTLSSVSGCPHHIDTDILLIDHDIHFLCFRHDRHSDRRRMDSAAALRLRNSLHTVHTTFIFQSGIRS